MDLDPGAALLLIDLQNGARSRAEGTGSMPATVEKPRFCLFIGAPPFVPWSTFANRPPAKNSAIVRGILAIASSMRKPSND